MYNGPNKANPHPYGSSVISLAATPEVATLSERAIPTVAGPYPTRMSDELDPEEMSLEAMALVDHLSIIVDEDEQYIDGQHHAAHEPKAESAPYNDD